MIKKIFKFLKALVVGSVWTVIFVYIAENIMIYLWNFDILNTRDWQIINSFWESGGKIKAGKDYIFILMLLALIPLWFCGWKWIPWSRGQYDGLRRCGCRRRRPGG